MKTISKVLFTAFAATLICGSAMADGNPINGITPKKERTPDWVKVEEPALRPYKAVFRGVRALVFHTVKGLADGNEKWPGIGSVEIFRGFRVGMVELTNSTYKGMAGSKMPDYKVTTKPNKVIEKDIVLRNAADGLTAGFVFAGAGAGVADAAKAGTAIFAGQKIVDRSPVDPKRKERADERKSRRKEAQERYLEHRANINNKPENTGNLVRKFRSE